jgi:hypothetical protein
METVPVALSFCTRARSISAKVFCARRDLDLRFRNAMSFKRQLRIIDERQPLPDLDAIAFADRQFVDGAADAGSGRRRADALDRGEYRLDVGDIAPFDGEFRGGPG